MKISFKNHDNNNSFTIEFQPRNSINDNDSKSGILTFMQKYKEVYHRDENYKSISNKENFFTITPLLYNKDNKHVIEKIFLFLEQSYNSSRNIDKDVEFNVNLIYQFKYKISLAYKDGELTFKVTSIDDNMEELDTIINFSTDYDYEIESLYNFFNAVMHFLYHKSEAIALGFYEMEGSWSNIKLNYIRVD